MRLTLGNSLGVFPIRFTSTIHRTSKYQKNTQPSCKNLHGYVFFFKRVLHGPSGKLLQNFETTALRGSGFSIAIRKRWLQWPWHLSKTSSYVFPQHYGNPALAEISPNVSAMIKRSSVPQHAWAQAVAPDDFLVAPVGFLHRLAIAPF